MACRQAAKETLEAIVSGEGELYLAYRRLYGIWSANNAAVQELRPLFRMEGIEADGTFSITDEFRARVLELAREILPHFLS